MTMGTQPGLHRPHAFRTVRGGSVSTGGAREGPGVGRSEKKQLGGCWWSVRGLNPRRER